MYAITTTCLLSTLQDRLVNENNGFFCGMDFIGLLPFLIYKNMLFCSQATHSKWLQRVTQLSWQSKTRSYLTREVMLLWPQTLPAQIALPASSPFKVSEICCCCCCCCCCCLYVCFNFHGALFKPAQQVLLSVKSDLIENIIWLVFLQFTNNMILWLIYFLQ